MRCVDGNFREMVLVGINVNLKDRSRGSPGARVRPLAAPLEGPSPPSSLSLAPPHAKPGIVASGGLEAVRPRDCL